MMNNTYLFYDIETTGLNRAFDQILRFAAIRTDLQLTEIERHLIRIRLRPDVIPSPAALLTNGLSVSDLTEGAGEFEAVREIHDLMNRPGTISIGYNTLGFDDEFLRFTFYRNLLSPYTHQYRNQCRRMDIFPMTIIYHLFRPELLNWPDIDGRPSLKLEHIAQANRLVDGPHHDAMVDTEATLALARMLATRRKIWRYLTGCFDKQTDLRRLKELPICLQGASEEHRQAIMVAGEFGARQNFQAPVLSIGNSIPYPNQSLWLRMDLPEIRRTEGEHVSETTWIVRKRLGEPGILLPPLQRYWDNLEPERRAQFDLNARWLETHPREFKEIIDYYRNYRYPFIPNLDPDAALYQTGFFPREDEQRCRRFHAGMLEEKIILCDRFSSKEAAALARRIIIRNFSDRLPPDLAAERKRYLQQINPPTESEATVDYRGNPRLSPRAALNEIKTLQQNGALGNSESRLLADLQAYIAERFPIG
jgi:exodeoxyribonuclease-1